MPQRPSIVASIAAAIAIVALALTVVGSFGAHAGLLRPFPGFRLFLIGLLLGPPALVLGLVGLAFTRRRPGRGRAWLATIWGAVLVALFLALYVPSSALPLINDITTSPADPPAFDSAAGGAAYGGRSLRYPPAFARLQHRAYPGLRPIRLDVPPARALAQARRAAQALGWTVTKVDPGRGRLEATDTSRVFRFVDDIVVRVRAAPEGGSRVDVRSRSRVGKGDFGTNAHRIRAFAKQLRAEPSE